MSYIEALKNEIIKGREISREEALLLYEQPLEELCAGADEIRKFYLGDRFDLCSIVNGKSGRCSENCKFCAQSSASSACISNYSLLSADEIVEQAKLNYELGVHRYSIVTSGKRLSNDEVDAVCEAVRQVRHKVGSMVCVSLGLLNEEQYIKLRKAGVTRVHNNLETSRRFFSQVCTTHTFDDKIEAILAAQRAGLFVCSGGIMGIGEAVEDRIDMAFTLRDLGIKSVPVNMLNPISGTPLENSEKLTVEDMRRIVAIYRFILPDAFIRLAGGRGLMADKGKSCFTSGANAAISGNMLTTSGISADIDKRILEELGYTIEEL